MSAEERETLLEGIRAHGVQKPLDVTAEGVVLDGHERLRAAWELELEFVEVRVVSPPDEVEYMVSAELQRRSLSPSQRAAIAIGLEEYQQACVEADARRRANLRGAEVAALPPRGKTRDFAAALVGVSPRLVQDAQTLKKLDPELFEAVKAGRLVAGRALKQARRERRDAALAPAPPLPEGPFEVIYADPPWQLGNPSSDYAPENHYPTMPLEEIKALPVPAAEDAVLFLWAVNSLLPEAFEVMAAWGFEYRTNLPWIKPSIGLGVWTRNRHELLLLGRKGSFPPPEEADRPDSVIEAPRGRHSEKPAVVYERIERMYPSASRVELFARKVRPGWRAWGNEVAA